MNWYYALHGKQQGPASEEELARLAASGTISEATLVWREGLGDWQPLSVARPDLISVAVTGLQVGGASIPSEQKDIIVQQLREGVISSIDHGAVQFAGFWWRVLAYIIDAVCLFVIGMAISIPVSIIGSALAGGNDPSNVAAFATANAAVGLVNTFFQMVASAIYYTYLTGKYGATPGKLALGFQVVRSPDLSQLTYLRAFGRWGAALISGIVAASILVIIMLVIIAMTIGFEAVTSGRSPDNIASFLFAMFGGMFLGLFPAMAPYWMAAFHKEKCALHDLIASTRVIRKR